MKLLLAHTPTSQWCTGFFQKPVSRSCFASRSNNDLFFALHVKPAAESSGSLLRKVLLYTLELYLEEHSARQGELGFVWKWMHLWRLINAIIKKTQKKNSNRCRRMKRRVGALHNYHLRMLSTLSWKSITALFLFWFCFVCSTNVKMYNSFLYRQL